MIDKFDRLELRIEKYQKFKELLDDCYTVKELAEKFKISKRTAYKIIDGATPNRMGIIARRTLIERGRRYKTIRKAMLFYGPKRTAKIIKIREQTCYSIYKDCQERNHEIFITHN